MPEFTPPWWLRNAHVQTVFGRIVRPRRLVELERETIETPDGDELVLDHLPAAGHEPTAHFILLHGLEGSSNSVYMQGLLSAIARRGRSEEHTSELQSRRDLVCRLLLEKKKKKTGNQTNRRRSTSHI